MLFHMFEVNALIRHVAGNRAAAVKVGMARCWSTETALSADAKVHVGAIGILRAITGLERGEESWDVAGRAEVPEEVAGETRTAICITLAKSGSDDAILDNLDEELHRWRIQVSGILFHGDRSVDDIAELIRVVQVTNVDGDAWP